MPPVVWLVEDDATLGHVIGIILDSAGYGHEWFRDGAEPLRRLRRGERPALILLDLVMPGVDGNAVLQEAVGRQSGPVVLMTGCIDRVRDDLKHYPVGVLSKPFLGGELIEAVRTALEGQPA